MYTIEVYVIMFIEPHGKCPQYLSIHLSSFFSLPSFLPSFLLSFLLFLFFFVSSSFQLGLEEIRGLPSREGKQKPSICGFFLQVHKFSS